MGGVGFYPDFRFPCNVIDMPFEFPKIGKNTDINFSCLALYKHLLQFNLSFRRKRAV
jgi:hypothetical protein